MNTGKASCKADSQRPFTSQKQTQCIVYKRQVSMARMLHELAYHNKKELEGGRKMRRPGQVGWSSSALRLFTALSLVLAAPIIEIGAAVAATKIKPAASPAGFRFHDVDGRTVQLDKFRGKWVVVNFWAHWCPLCWPEVPKLNALNARDDVMVIGVAMDYGPDEMAVHQAIKRQGMRYKTQILGGNRISADAAYRQVGPVSFYPTTYIYNPQGLPHARINGPVSIERFQAVIQEGL